MGSIMGNRTRLVTITVFIVSLIIFSLTSGGNTAFNHFTLLADSFIHGKIYIEGDMPWLEKIPIDSTKFYVANPPMPAIVSIVPVATFGKDLPQVYISFVIGSLLVAVTFLVSLKINNSLRLATWSSILVGFGTINWYMISVGSTWYLAQVFSQLFLTIAILSIFKNKQSLPLRGKSPFLTGLFLGFAYLSRIPTILTVPFFLIHLPKPFLRSAFFLCLGIAPSFIINFLYNYLRFGVIWDIGYTLIPGVSTEPWFQKGLINPAYIIEHLKIIFATIPNISHEFPYIKPSLFGYAIWFTTPAFIFSFKNSIDKRSIRYAWISIMLVSLLIFSHGSTGFSQFGYRFAADFYPILIYLTIYGVSKSDGPKLYHWIFLSLGVLVNFWSILFLNILKWA